MADEGLLRSASRLLLVGVLISIVAGLFHPARELANNHAAVFAEYASSTSWTLVHLGQFIGMAGIVGGFLILAFAIRLNAGVIGWAGRLGAASAITALALYGVLQAVDGVALKQAVNAWVSAPDPEKTARFASAEAIRWLEWGVRSYQSFMLGLSFVLFGVAIATLANVPKPIGYLMGLSGLAYLLQGWILGNEGFSAALQIPVIAGIVLILVWSIWLFISSWHVKTGTETSVS